MWFLSKLKSIGLFLSIEFIRLSDHLIRALTGLPTQKRSEITPSLFLGGQYSEKGYRILSERGITGIVNMRETPLSSKIKGTITVCHLPTKDLNAPSLADLQKGISFITTQLADGGKVYVHCYLGEGRGPTMIIAYLMSTGMFFDDAHALVKKIRPFIRLTSPQRNRLLELENLLHPEVISPEGAL